MYVGHLRHLLTNMGRYAQARRRGGSAEIVTLPPPPTPSLEEFGENRLRSLSDLVVNDDGTMQLWYGGYPDVPVAMFQETAWSQDVDWGDRAELPKQWLRARAVGGGTNFVGYSAWSSWYDNTGA